MFITLDSLRPSRYNPRRSKVNKDFICQIRDEYNICSKVRKYSAEELTYILNSIKRKYNLKTGTLKEIKKIINLACELKGDPQNLRYPVLFIESDSSHKEISIGGSRVLAHHLMRAEKIKACPINYASKEERISNELDETLSSSDIDQIDIILGLKHLQASTGKTLSVTEIQNRTRKARGSAHQMQRILSYPHQILFDLIADNYFSSIHSITKILDHSKEELLAFAEERYVDSDLSPALFKITSSKDLGAVIFLINEMASSLQDKIDFMDEGIPQKETLQAELNIIQRMLDKLDPADPDSKMPIERLYNAVSQMIVGTYQDIIIISEQMSDLVKQH